LWKTSISLRFLSVLPLRFTDVRAVTVCENKIIVLRQSQEISPSIGELLLAILKEMVRVTYESATLLYTLAKAIILINISFLASNKIFYTTGRFLN